MRSVCIKIGVVLLVAAIVHGSLSFDDSESQMSTNIGQADFAVNLLKHVAEKNEPTVFSPFSISVALAMTLVGAEGQTKEQMIATLAKGSNVADLNKHFSALLKEINEKNDGYKLSSANRIYLRDTFTPKQTYMDIVNAYYNGEFKVADFDKVAALVQEINSWVESQTNSKIKDLISEDAITAATVMVLLNAVYFKGDWAVKFDETATQKKQFREAENKERTVDMMHLKSKFHYMEDEDVQVLALPYKNTDLSMYVFLPKEDYGLKKLIGKMNGQWLLEHMNGLKMEVDVQLPKFKIEAQMGLVPTLQKLGIKDAFDGRANFSGIADAPILISDVIHKAFIEINEAGTEAAAATGVIATFAMFIPDEPKTFIADHPFLYAIAMNEKILFIGTYL